MLTLCIAWALWLTLKCNPSNTGSTSNDDTVAALPICPSTVVPIPVLPSIESIADPLLNNTVPTPILNDPWTLSTNKVLEVVTTPIAIISPLPFPLPSVPTPTVSPTT